MNYENLSHNRRNRRAGTQTGQAHAPINRRYRAASTVGRQRCALRPSAGHGAELREDNRSLIGSMRQAHNACSEHKDVATVSLIENYIDQVEKRVWFLYESQQGQGANRVIICGAGAASCGTVIEKRSWPSKCKARCENQFDDPMADAELKI